MTTNPPPYRRFGDAPKLRHDSASAVAAYPIANAVAARDLLRVGHHDEALAVLERLPQLIYDAAGELYGQGGVDGWTLHQAAAQRARDARRRRY